MSETKHSQGEFIIHPMTDVQNVNELMANVNLFLAASDLLEACEELSGLEFLYALHSNKDSEQSIVHCALQRARKAIAKAKGESHE